MAQSSEMLAINEEILDDSIVFEGEGPCLSTKPKEVEEADTQLHCVAEFVQRGKVYLKHGNLLEAKDEFRDARNKCAHIFNSLRSRKYAAAVDTFIRAAGYYWMASNHILYAHCNTFTLDEYLDHWENDFHVIFLTSMGLTKTETGSLPVKVLKPVVRHALKNGTVDLGRLLTDIKTTITNLTTESRVQNPDEDQAKSLVVTNKLLLYLLHLADGDCKCREKWNTLLSKVITPYEQEEILRKIEQERIDTIHSGANYDDASSKCTQVSLAQRAAEIFDGKEIKQLMLDTINPSGIISHLSGWCLNDYEMDAIRNTMVHMDGGRHLAVERVIKGIQRSLQGKENEHVGHHFMCIIDTFETVYYVHSAKLIRLLREAKTGQGL